MTVSLGLAVTHAACSLADSTSGGDMQNAFQSWIGQKVIVQLAFGPAKVSLRGMFLRDQEKTLLMRPEAGPDIEIAKARVLAIEEVKRRSHSLPWRLFE